MKKIFYITIPVLLICIVFIYNISIKIPYNDPEKLFEYYKENKNIHQEKVINALANTRNKTYLEYLEKDYYNEINESEIIAGFVKNTMVFSDRERIFAKYLNENNNELSSMVSMIDKNELINMRHVKRRVSVRLVCDGSEAARWEHRTLRTSGTNLR